jgi:two-component system, cell cycle sensor histidine kinase and response regulator CckA
VGTPLRALIIEDYEDDALILVRELKHGGFDVEFKRVDKAAVLKSTLETDDWDLVISDFSLPGFSGMDALKLVRSLGSELPFIFVSGTMGEETAVAALKDGAQDYLVKSNLNRLVPAVQRELREAEARRQRKELELQVHQLQKFEAIGRLAGGIAHDFNNVIGAILGWAEMGCDDTLPGSRDHDRFQKIRGQAQWAGRLTSQLLAFARKQMLQPKKVNLNLLVPETISLLERVIGEQIRVRTILAPDLSVSSVDPTLVEQALVNLCLNARDAMPNGGELIVETRNAKIGAEYCRQHAYAKPGDYVMLCVSDNGKGMDRATLDKVFEPFFTTKEVGKGTGLGLATVYGVVKQHGGFIYAYSEPGKGSSFRLYFPAASGVHEMRDAHPDDHLRKGTEQILLADDHEGLRESAREMLQGLGYQVITATNGSEAVGLFKAHPEQIDLVIMDVVMPLLNGPEAFLQMSAIRPGLRAIFTSGYSAESESLKSALERGTVILQKPYSLKSLSRAVRTALDSPVSV